MPSIEAELKTYLKTITAVTDIVGTGNSSRIYEDIARQGVAAPYIVLQTFEGISAEHLGGITGIARNRIQIDCYGKTGSESHDLAEAVRLAPLQMFRGTMGSTFVHSVVSEFGYRKGYYYPTNGSDERHFWRSRDYFVTYAEPTS